MDIVVFCIELLRVDPTKLGRVARPLGVSCWVQLSSKASRLHRRTALTNSFDFFQNRQVRLDESVDWRDQAGRLDLLASRLPGWRDLVSSAGKSSAWRRGVDKSSKPE